MSQSYTHTQIDDDGYYNYLPWYLMHIRYRYMMKVTLPISFATKKKKEEGYLLYTGLSRIIPIVPHKYYI